ncbi:MAG: hypothetical protein ABSA94_20195 [Acidobacteriaceae bacterium]
MDSNYPIRPNNSPQKTSDLPRPRELTELLSTWTPLAEEDQMPEILDLPPDPVDL